MRFGGLLSGVTLPWLVMFLGDSETNKFVEDLVTESELLILENEEKAFELKDFTDFSSLVSSCRGFSIQFPEVFIVIIFEFQRLL